MENIERHFTQLSFDENELRREFLSAVQITSGGLLLCTRGSCDIVFDIKQYSLKQWDMAVALPYSVIQVLRLSDDFDFVIIGANIGFFLELQIPNKGGFFTNIKEHPSVSLKREEAEGIIALYNKLIHEQQRTYHPFRNEIVDSVMKIISYEVAAIYQDRKPISEQNNTRSERIFYSFISQLLSDFKSQRSLQYYAEKQQITPSHLSRCVKSISGRRASEWVYTYVINSVKMSLQNHDLSIAEIADEYHFPNSSFFTQYFKKYEGRTPREYRMSMDSK